MGCMLQKAPACLGMSLHCRQNCKWLRHLEQGLCLSLLSPQNDMLVLLAAAQGIGCGHLGTAAHCLPCLASGK